MLSALSDIGRRRSNSTIYAPLARTRWPERETVNNWSQGVPLAKLRALVVYWRVGYDWRRCEAALGRIPQFRTTLDGLGIHFIHVRSKHPNALPIIITHGWPGSIIEFMQIIAPLTDPTAHGGRAEDAFHFVAPSLPGFGFSDKPSERGWNADRIAKAWGELMGRLGYRRFVAQGGDWGTFVTTRMAQLHVPGLAAIHLTMPQVIPDKLPATLTAAQKRALDAQKRFETDQFGYFALQMTRPQTIGYPLADSPAGQAAWIYEKFHAWTDDKGDPEDALTRDQMLDNITLYWLTDTAASSARIYAEHAGRTTRSRSERVDRQGRQQAAPFTSIISYPASIRTRFRRILLRQTVRYACYPKPPVATALYSTRAKRAWATLVLRFIYSRNALRDYRAPRCCHC